eukprot:CAMPEP_0170560344 /NCGR_PEP_ID=MMETSP0211-20121228/48295_1 /TAXON_ID=311385 /ORGANISM="Pseudokeronopsis sp., Strain OXSARD2" /LENGTH=41 /DNA_ID= /DNA_START= /DNA_END= /DNA_ORIENTATION=
MKEELKMLVRDIIMERIIKLNVIELSQENQEESAKKHITDF